MRPTSRPPSLRLPLFLAALTALAIPTVAADDVPDEQVYAVIPGLVLPGCDVTIGSSPETRWTARDPTGTEGTLQPSVVVPNPGPWFDIPGGQSIWKSDSNPPGPSLLTPVTFNRTFLGCGIAPTQGRLVINGDNAYEAFLNGVRVAGCGVANLGDPVSQGCFRPGSENRVTVNVLPGPNELVVLAWNTALGTGGVSSPGPAMIQYALTF